MLPRVEAAVRGLGHYFPGEPGDVFVVWNLRGRLRLTMGRGQGILGVMSARPALMLLLVLALILVLCTSSICLIPAGRGSFSAVHGPDSIFLARRALGRVLSFIRTSLVVAFLPALVGWINAVNDSVFSPVDKQPLICGLIC